MEKRYKAGVLTISDACSRGEREDVSGTTLASRLEDAGFDLTRRQIVPDEKSRITDCLKAWCADCDVILTTGGTGFSPRDVTPEAMVDVIERDAPGLAEMLRWTGYQKTNRAALSRGRAGIRGRTLIVNLPGNPKAVEDGVDILIPLLPHALALLKEEPVDH